MPECHTCKVAEHIASGRYARTPFERTPCAKCNAGKPGSHHGRVHVRFVDNLNGVTPPAEVDCPEVDRDHRDVIATLGYLLKMLCGLPPRTRQIVLDRIAYPEKSVHQLARSLGIGDSAANESLKRALRKCPALAEAFPMRSWRWANRNPRPTVRID